MGSVFTGVPLSSCKPNERCSGRERRRIGFCLFFLSISLRHLSISVSVVLYIIHFFFGGGEQLWPCANVTGKKPFGYHLQYRNRMKNGQHTFIGSWVRTTHNGALLHDYGFVFGFMLFVLASFNTRRYVGI